MRDLRGYLKKYNLGMDQFAALIRSGRGSLVRYENEDPGLRDSTAEKIELGLYLLDKYNLVAPKWDGGFSLGDFIAFDVKRNKYWDDVREYNKRFRELFDKEYLV